MANRAKRPHTMKTEQQINYLKRAYNLGRKHAENGDYCSWYTPRLEMAYNCGYDGTGIDFDTIVTGYRYGYTPSGCSYNYRDNRKEAGVSLAAINGQPEIGSSIWFPDRQKVQLSGLLISDKGSDGEPLIIPLDMDEQFDF